MNDFEATLIQISQSIVFFIFVLLIIGIIFFATPLLPANTENSLFLHQSVLSAVLTPAIFPSPSPSPLSSFAPTPTTTSSTRAPTPTMSMPNGYCVTAPIFMYHHVKPIDLARKEGHAQFTIDNATFEHHMAYLKQEGYTTLSVDDIVTALLTHTKLPPKNITVTIDDAYQDVYQYAYPIAQKYQIHLNLMVPTGLLGNAGYITHQQLKEMAESPLVSLYNHTWSHANLAFVSSDTLRYEVVTAKKYLEDLLGKQSTIFSYPYGDYSSHVQQFLQAHGYLAALSTLQGTTQCDSFLMSLRRSRIGNHPLSSYGF